MNTDINLADRGSYDFFEPEKIRFSDTDMIGHVNNVAFAALLETGRTGYTQAHLIRHLPRELLVVMARVEIDYRRELHWPARVDVGSRIMSVGRSSFVIGQGIFREETCFTTGRTTLVVIDRKTRGSTPIPPDYRAALEAMLP